MKKEDLKNGMVVELEDGNEYIVVGDTIDSSNGDWDRLCEYNDDLTHRKFSILDMMIIYNFELKENEDREKVKVWERPWTPEKDEVCYVADPTVMGLCREMKWFKSPSTKHMYDSGLIFKRYLEAAEMGEKMLALAKEDK